jgi:hypothetical protein
MERAMVSDASGLLWLAINVVMPILLLAAIIYGAIRWRNRPRSPAIEQLRDQKTRDNYRKEDAVKQG